MVWHYVYYRYDTTGDFGLCISGWVIKKFAPSYACVSSIPPCVVINEPNLKNIVSSGITPKCLIWLQNLMSIRVWRGCQNSISAICDDIIFSLHRTTFTRFCVGIIWFGGTAYCLQMWQLFCSREQQQQCVVSIYLWCWWDNSNQQSLIARIFSIPVHQRYHRSCLSLFSRILGAFAL